MSEYPSNSRTRQPRPQEKGRPKMEPVVQNEVKRRKRSLGSRFRDNFGVVDGQSVAHYIFLDVLIPAAKDAVVDAVTQGIERLIFGENRPRSTGSSRGRSSGTFVDYRSASTSSSRTMPRNEPEGPALSRRARRSHDFGEIVLATRAEADEVLDRLFSLVSQYENASVADLYDMLNISGEYTDEKWGWVELRGANVRRARGGGYLLELPPPESLGR